MQCLNGLGKYMKIPVMVKQERGSVELEVSLDVLPRVGERLIAAHEGELYNLLVTGVTHFDVSTFHPNLADQHESTLECVPFSP